MHSKLSRKRFYHRIIQYLQVNEIFCQEHSSNGTITNMWLVWIIFIQEIQVQIRVNIERRSGLYKATRRTYIKLEMWILFNSIQFWIVDAGIQGEGAVPSDLRDKSLAYFNKVLCLINEKTEFLEFSLTVPWISLTLSF